VRKKKPSRTTVMEAELGAPLAHRRRVNNRQIGRNWKLIIFLIKFKKKKKKKKKKN
jgi:hypothetical protein